MNRLIDSKYFVLFGIGFAALYWLLETLMHARLLKTGSFTSEILPLSDQNEIWMRLTTVVLFVGFGFYAHRVAGRRRRVEQERERLIAELQHSLAEIRDLRGMLPICAHCKKVRDDKGYWENLETYLCDHQHIDFTHGICPECMAKYYPEYARR